MEIPLSPFDITPELMTGIVRRRYPEALVTAVEIVRAHEYGEGDVSTSSRATARLAYSDPACELPKDIVLKLSFDPRVEGTDAWFCNLTGLFDNEVDFYNRIRPELSLEAPLALGGYFDEATGRYILAMEDVTRRGARFPSNQDDIALDHVKRILSTVARLHAQFWESERFQDDLAWVETHLSGRVETHMRSVIPEKGIASELQQHKFKREILERLGTSERELFAGMCANKLHQSKLPQTLLHGDLHIGNTYLMPDGTVGLHDWQLCVKGFALHDVTYIINTSLSVSQRRVHERDLLEHYRDCLVANGLVSPPDMDMLWREHRRAALWTLYIGWLTCPPLSYGWDTLAVALLRVSTAVEDHETLALVREGL